MDKVKVSDEIIKVMDELGKRVGMAVDWTQQNVMPQLQDFLHRVALFEIRTSIMWIVIGVIIILIGIAIEVLESKNNYSEGVLYVFTFFGVIIGLMIIATQAYDIIQAMTIPEKIWLDYLQQYKSSLR